MRTFPNSGDDRTGGSHSGGAESETDGPRSNARVSPKICQALSPCEGT